MSLRSHSRSGGRDGVQIENPEIVRRYDASNHVLIIRCGRILQHEYQYMDRSQDPSEVDITALLQRVKAGDPGSEDQLLAVVYSQLRRLASAQLRREAPGHTLQTTALVHEAYLRLFKGGIDYQDRRHFFSLAARAMRRVLVDYARMQTAECRGGRPVRVPLENLPLISPENIETVLAMDQCMNLLARQKPQHAQLVELHLFAGMTIQDSAQVLNVSVRTAKRHWAFAQAWLYANMAPGGAGK